MSDTLFSVQNLNCATEDGTTILKGVDLKIQKGELHAIMGPNGSGKSTLASLLLGNPEYKTTKGKVEFNGQDITEWTPEERGKAGIFLAFQYPQSLPGVSVNNFLRQALNARKQEEQPVLELRMKILEWMEKLNIDPSFADRFVNDGFSGGEKKRNEILQMAILEPELAILDETDSGLDIDALKVVSQGIQEIRKERPDTGLLVVTHFQRLLDLLQPDCIHILIDGQIVASGGMELATELEAKGYESWQKSNVENASNKSKTADKKKIEKSAKEKAGLNAT